MAGLMNPAVCIPDDNMGPQRPETEEFFLWVRELSLHSAAMRSATV